MQTNLPEYKIIFYNDGYELGKEALIKGRDDEALFAAIERMHDAIDQLIESLDRASKKNGTPINCAKGCSWCCHQPVFANTYELHYLKNYIRNSFTKKEMEEVQERARSKNELTSKLTEDQLLKNKTACPALKNGACAAYHARPMACRIYLSTNVATCLEFYKNPDNEQNYPALLDFPLQAGRMMNEGFMAALAEAGIETEEFRLEEGLSKLSERF